MKIAVIGTGVSGLSAAYSLHEENEVTCYESEERIGGHAWSQMVDGIEVDTGFIVFNQISYPNLVNWFEENEVSVQASDMSFSVSRFETEWSSDSLTSFYGHWSSLLDFQYHKMAIDIIRFKGDVERSLKNGIGEMTLEQFLRKYDYSSYFLEYYLLPQVACIWSCPREEAMKFPAVFIFNFFKNHQLLQIFGRPQWLTLAERSSSYLEKVSRKFSDRIKLNSAVVSVENRDGGVLVRDINGEEDLYDHVVMTVPATAVLEICKDLTEKQRELLSTFKFQSNDIWLHKDANLMPKKRKFWSSWNCLGDHSLYPTYYLNRLQSLDTDQDIFISLNPPNKPREDLVVNSWTALHPVPTMNSVRAQLEIPTVQGDNNIWFAGAYLGYGFHECGLVSGQKVANLIMDRKYKSVPAVSQLSYSILDSVQRNIVIGIIKKYIKKGLLEIYEVGGNILRFGDGKGPSAKIRVHSPSFYKNISYRYDLGLADSYIEGSITCDLLELFRVLILNRDSGSNSVNPVVTWIGRKAALLGHKARKNSMSNTRRNISEHYDLGNDFFELFLDESMTYSCGIFRHPDDTLYDCQQNKLNALIEKAQVGPNDRVLEIGFGWGALSVALVKQTGCTVVGYTLSAEQKAWAEELVEREGLSDKIQYHLADYRTITGTFTRIISCEMIEAVGHEYMDVFYQKLNDLLEPNGRLVIQAITIPDERFNDYINSTDFIQEYIFPGGELPCHSLLRSSAEKTALKLDQCEEIGTHYATTLRRWLENFRERKKSILAIEGLDEGFFRTWEYYFQYCEAGFETETLGTCQLAYFKQVR
eukprot:TRINITY_DN2997_c0_g4_i1.p1 TRINITY_DN2997_c0_g4~~TRINITY_DN2997_c0_g4_i1.p1  ORF type:complete len:814 (-),score=141.29 TRINITY_DN2997_c0_g4_i1:98-2539(-)